MKNSFSFRCVIVFIAIMLVTAGCQMDGDLETELGDVPELGIMTKKTADRVFFYEDDTVTAGGIAIIHLKDAGVLRDYLDGKTRRQAEAERGELTIRVIAGKPVTRIAGEAFAPSEEYPADITQVVKKVNLPPTIAALGPNLFAGTEYFIDVEIPPQAVENIKNHIKDEIRTATIAKERERLEAQGKSEEEIAEALTAAAAQVEDTLASAEAAVDALVVKAVVDAVAGSTVRVSVPADPAKPEGDPVIIKEPIVGNGEVVKVPEAEGPPPELPPPSQAPDVPLPPGLEPPPVTAQPPLSPDRPVNPNPPVSPNPPLIPNPPFTPAPPDTSPTSITISALEGVTKPVTGATAVSTITATAQFTGTVAWAPALEPGDKFAAGKSYTATITISPKAGYTLTGVSQNFFTVAGAATVTNAAGSGVVKVVFPATFITVTDIVLDSLVTAPVRGATPDTTINATQYSGTVAWKTGNDQTHSGAFAPGTVYKAVLTLTAQPGYTFTGVTANCFTYIGAASVTNAAGSGTVTITFPPTANTGFTIGDPSVGLYLDGGTSPLTHNGSTTITRAAGSFTFTVSIAPGNYDDEITWFLNGNVLVQQAGQTSITLSKVAAVTYFVTVEVIPTGGVKNSGSHTFVVN
jgi:hypothetical protein